MGIQSQAAAAAQLAQHQVSVQGQGQRSSVMSCPTDPNAAAIAIMLAAQKQQHNLQQDTTSFIPQHQRKQTQVEPVPTNNPLWSFSFKKCSEFSRKWHATPLTSRAFNEFVVFSSTYKGIVYPSTDCCCEII